MNQLQKQNGAPLRMIPDALREPFQDRILSTYEKQIIFLNNDHDVLFTNIPSIGEDLMIDLEFDYLASIIMHDQTGIRDAFIHSTKDMERMEIEDYAYEIVEHSSDNNYYHVLYQEISRVLDYYHLSYLDCSYYPIRNEVTYNLLNNPIVEIW